MVVGLGGRAYQMIGVYTTFTFLTTVSVALRLYCRTAIVKKFALDDYLAVAAWAIFCLHTSFSMTGVAHGTGQHVPDINPPSALPTALKYWWLCEPVYVLCNMFAKASIAVMLLRLTINPLHRLTIYTTLIITEVYSFGFIFLFLFQCSPIPYFWTRVLGASGTCLPTHILINCFYIYSVIVCVGDWVFAVLPYFLVWKLQMTTQSKIVVIIILALGGLASTATIIRFPYVGTLADAEDFLYATTDVAIWSCTETGLGITTACLATLRPLLRLWLDRLGVQSLSGRSKGTVVTFGGGGAARTRLERRGVAMPEVLDMSIRKTTRVSVDQFGGDDGDSTKSNGSETRITGAVGNNEVGDAASWTERTPRGW